MELVKFSLNATADTNDEGSNDEGRSGRCCESIGIFFFFF